MCGVIVVSVFINAPAQRGIINDGSRDGSFGISRTRRARKTKIRLSVRETGPRRIRSRAVHAIRRGIGWKSASRTTVAGKTMEIGGRRERGFGLA